MAQKFLFGDIRQFKIRPWLSSFNYKLIIKSSERVPQIKNAPTRSIWFILWYTFSRTATTEKKNLWKLDVNVYKGCKFKCLKTSTFLLFPIQFYNENNLYIKFLSNFLEMREHSYIYGFFSSQLIWVSENICSILQ